MRKLNKNPQDKHKVSYFLWAYAQPPVNKKKGLRSYLIFRIAELIKNKNLKPLVLF